MFPPGRARLATNPLPTGSLSCAMTMGIVAVASLAARVSVEPAVTMTSTLRRTSSAASVREAIEFSLRRSPLNDNVFPLHVPKLAQPLAECLDAGRGSGKREHAARISYPGDFRRLLRLCPRPANREYDSESNNPHQFSILDFRFPIVGIRITKRESRACFFHVSFLPSIENRQSKI